MHLSFQFRSVFPKPPLPFLSLFKKKLCSGIAACCISQPYFGSLTWDLCTVICWLCQFFPPPTSKQQTTGIYPLNVQLNVPFKHAPDSIPKQTWSWTAGTLVSHIWKWKKTQSINERRDWMGERGKEAFIEVHMWPYMAGQEEEHANCFSVFLLVLHASLFRFSIRLLLPICGWLMPWAKHLKHNSVLIYRIKQAVPHPQGHHRPTGCGVVVLISQNSLVCLFR